MASLQGFLVSLPSLESCLHKSWSDFQLLWSFPLEWGGKPRAFLKERLMKLHFCGVFPVLEELLSLLVGKDSSSCLG